MGDVLIELDPVDRITADAVGPPGERMFFLQARKDDRLITLLVEKQQVQLLAASVVEILSRLRKDTGQGPPEEAMALEEPVIPEWRAGRLSIEYEDDRDLILLEIEELVPGQLEDEDEDDEDEEDEDDEDDDEGLPEIGIEIEAVDLSQMIREQERGEETNGGEADGDGAADEFEGEGEPEGEELGGEAGFDIGAGQEGGPDEPPREPSRVRLWATREQMLSLARHGASVCAKGRPRCQLCGNPIDPEGHICPMLNGHHKRTAR
jgi:uncharacterized repeat protein (TIGR03847 family)